MWRMKAACEAWPSEARQRNSDTHAALAVYASNAAQPSISYTEVSLQIHNERTY